MRQGRAIGCWLFLISAVLAAQSSLADAPANAQPLVLNAAHLFDSISGNLVDRGVIVVSGTTIQAVGSNTRIPDNAKIIDLGEATLLPGFIDAHVHLESESGPSYYLDFYQGIMRSDYVSLGLRNAIRAGVSPAPACSLRTMRLARRAVMPRPPSTSS